MPAPGSYFFSDGAKVDAQDSFKDRVDAGASGGSIKLRDESDTLLSQIPLTDPCGTTSAAGVLTITASGPDLSADASGTCSYGEICDSDDNVECTMPAEEGTVAVSGKIVLSKVAIVAGEEVELVSCVIGG